MKLPDTGARAHIRQPGVSDDIDYEIHGNEMQYVEIELDPGETCIAEAGAMMFKHPDIAMQVVFGDGRDRESGFFDKLAGAGKRVITGESLFATLFTNEGYGKARAAFAAPFPGTILPVKLDAMGGEIICQKDSFLCAARGVEIGIHFQRRILTGLFGGEGFVMQSLKGDGWVFVHAGGTLSKRELAPGEVLHVDTGCLAATSAGVEMDVERVGGIKSMIFGGEGVFFSRLVGPGTVWLQSLPFSRLAGRILAAAPSEGGKDRGEGSIVGTLGDLMRGDRRF